MSWVRLDHVIKYSSTRRVVLAPAQTVAEEGAPGALALGRGIRYHKNKPSGLRGLFRKTIEAQVGGETVFLNRRSSINYINDCNKKDKIKLKNPSNKKIMEKLIGIFGGEIHQAPAKKVKEPKVKVDKPVKTKAEKPVKGKVTENPTYRSKQFGGTNPLFGQ